MARRPQLEELQRVYGLPLITIEEMIRHRVREEPLISKTTAARVPTRHGTFTCHAWRSLIDGIEHLAFSYGDLDGADPTLVRVHSECLTGDVFGSERCDCGAQLDDALAAIAREGRGAVVYLRGHEGRGIGISQKLDAYNLQDRGHDTVDANLELGLPVDARQYWMSAQILVDLGIKRVRLLTNNPAKCRALSELGIEIADRVPLPPRATDENIAYLNTKPVRLGHLMDPDATTRA
jgi:3,4-dihydroxy 2-butanone 4-phosphate synthase/GTP cyclohydrolase II